MEGVAIGAEGPEVAIETTTVIETAETEKADTAEKGIENLEKIKLPFGDFRRNRISV